MVNNFYCSRLCTYITVLLSIILLSFFHSIQVKAERVICDATYDQGNPQIISDGFGGSITAWNDYRNGDWDVYAQRLNSAQETQWTENGVLISVRVGDQSDPKLISDGSGGAFIVYSGSGSDGYYDVFAQHVNSSGSLEWGTDGIHVCDQLKNQWEVNLVSDDAGGIIISWNDYRNNNYLCVYAQRLNSSGVPQWTDDGVFVAGLDYGQQDPVIVSDGSGGAIIAWNDNRKTPVDSEGIYAQRLNSSGITQWTANGVPVYAGPRYGQYPQIVSDGSGGAIITWYDDRDYPSGSLDIYAQRINSSGVPQWTANGVLVCGATGGQEHPQLVGDGSGGAFITWHDERVSNINIYAQRLNSSGVPQWTTDGIAVTNTSGYKFYPQIIRYGATDTIITWEDRRSGDYDVYAQRLDGSGANQWTQNGVLVYGESGDQEEPKLIGDGSGGALIVWDDNDIYMQHVYSGGQLTIPEVSFTSSDQVVDEDVYSTEITLQLSEVSDLDVTVPFTISGTATEGSYEDFTITESPVIFSAGSDSKTITVYINDDSEVETDETIIVTMETPTNASLDSVSVHTVTILDNEPTADIAVYKSVSQSKIHLNDQVVFTIEVLNNGPDDASGITISDMLPVGLSYVSHQAAKGTYAQESSQWILGDLTNGEASTLELTVMATQKGRIPNTATKTASTPTDPTTGNDADTAVLYVDRNVLSWLMLLLEDQVLFPH